MLVLSRKERESITLKMPNGDSVEICLLAYRGEVTKVGIKAAKDIKILRSELDNPKVLE